MKAKVFKVIICLLPIIKISNLNDILMKRDKCSELLRISFKNNCIIGASTAVEQANPEPAALAFHIGPGFTS